MAKQKYIVHQDHKITQTHRNGLLNQKSFAIWFTGLSGSGKSTLANLLEQRLYNSGKLTYILDGDNVRAGLNKDLDFSAEARKENIRRIGEVSKLMVDAGLIVISAFISPFEEDRQTVRQLFKPEEFIEVFVDCPLEVCEQRDVKGLYQKARKGIIKDFTGIDSPYEKPQNAEVIVKTSEHTKEECINQVIDFIEDKLQFDEDE